MLKPQSLPSLCNVIGFDHGVSLLIALARNWLRDQRILLRPLPLKLRLFQEMAMHLSSMFLVEVMVFRQKLQPIRRLLAKITSNFPEDWVQAFQQLAGISTQHLLI